ncbi:hypothetical protein XA68_10272 [Ophiocordyceps unilateralis]|uniref:Uncharacterized protein n=1 Tax=Ophiocordyceps unilateralis TaxID=268505 RepID=A0A2A9PIF6_OPHUN|nr:hypothetical protein XA68_10272 [Ophiocordyceps unilateralis]
MCYGVDSVAQRVGRAAGRRGRELPLPWPSPLIPCLCIRSSHNAHATHTTPTMVPSWPYPMPCPFATILTLPTRLPSFLPPSPSPPLRRHPPAHQQELLQTHLEDNPPPHSLPPKRDQPLQSHSAPPVLIWPDGSG